VNGVNRVMTVVDERRAGIPNVLGCFARHPSGMAEQHLICINDRHDCHPDPCEPVHILSIGKV